MTTIGFCPTCFEPWSLTPKGHVLPQHNGCPGSTEPPLHTMDSADDVTWWNEQIAAYATPQERRRVRRYKSLAPSDPTR